jgi:adenine-specific DNA methylase
MNLIGDQSSQLYPSSHLVELFNLQCSNTTIGSEWTFHQLAPYIGKIKSSIAKFLIENFSEKGETILDPFCGAGTIPFESLILGRNVIANDLNKYAYILTKAKLTQSESLDELISKIGKYQQAVDKIKPSVDLRKVPSWVRKFFHKETLRETIVWFQILEDNNEFFLLACLLGILHHQRPGFLSFPSSHTVPYLRLKSFPPKINPALYEYRSVKDRLLKKIARAYKRVPQLTNIPDILCYNKDASTLKLKTPVDVIISSPPYMRQLDYARDNRLRLWFLKITDFKALDLKISPKETDFLNMIKKCLLQWDKILKVNGRCVLFLGDNYSNTYKKKLPEILENIASNEVGSFQLIFKHESLIPQKRRVRRNYSGNKSETILVFKKVV